MFFYFKVYGLQTSILSNHELILANYNVNRVIAAQFKTIVDFDVFAKDVDTMNVEIRIFFSTIFEKIVIVCDYFTCFWFVRLVPACFSPNIILL